MPRPELILTMKTLLPLARLDRKDLQLLQSDAAAALAQQALDHREGDLACEELLHRRRECDGVHAHPPALQARPLAPPRARRGQLVLDPLHELRIRRVLDDNRADGVQPL